eukprot:TRINITY_DN47235_c0_g1_i1.p1 TRINITY_DN47235_c0_g1~~TRINITY_DN47235_c0_g1_i1.p1  ORF type:complete len:356 (+),score=149.42 TRINITY_DN47235_c0_g1_i1:60-1127(+)
MRTFTLMAVALCATAVSAAEYPMPEYEINLDLPPKDRWTKVMTELKDDVMVTLNWLMSVVGPKTALHPVAEELRRAVIEGKGWDDEFIAEMQGIATALNVTEDTVQLANLFYEYGPLACTGIVAQMTNGSVIHSRNQDYAIVGLPEITVWVKFTRNSQIVYQGTTFATYAGLPTVMRPHGWSVEANSRLTGWAVDIVENIKAAKQGGTTVGYFLRRGVEQQATYADAIRMMNTTLLIAPAYYTMVGTQPWEGAVVTRDRDGPANAKSNGEGIWSLNQTADAWFRVETNFDHWEPLQDGRRLAANRHMNSIGQTSITLDTLFEVLSTPPVLAGDTIYTAQMFPATGYYRAVMRRLK